MLGGFKEKSWSVFLAKGYLLNNQVRAERCGDCKSSCELLRVNYNNPNLSLYGCKNSKCQDHLVRLEFT